MLLPCPHCRRQFNLPTQQIPSQRARVKCPACGGLFVISLASPSGPAVCSTGPADDSRLRGNDGEDLHKHDMVATPSTGVCSSAHVTEAAPAGHTLDRGRPRFLLFWTLAPACCLLLALGGILLSGPWMGIRTPDLHPPQADIGPGGPLSSSASSHPDISRRQGNPAAQAFWAATADPTVPCEVLLRSQADLLNTGNAGPCQIYPFWITCLVLRTGPVSGCDPKPAFALASEGLQDKTLCGPGHAFLAAYYLEKRLVERSQSFLDEALRLAPDDPWVKLAEAVVYERAYDNDKKAILILENLSRECPSIPLARYLLGEAYIRGGKYRDAGAAFESLKGEGKGRIAFWRIRRALSSLERTAEQGLEQAEALLVLSRSFIALQDFPMAKNLYRRVLEEMPDGLPKIDRIAAYCELARIYEQEGDNSSAYQAYRNAFELNPEFPAAREGIRAVLPSRPDHPS